MAHASILARRQLACLALRRPASAPSLVANNWAPRPHASLLGADPWPRRAFVRHARVNPQHVRDALTKKYKVNEEIKSSTGKIRVIDENGENLGLMSLAQGVELAKEKAYDLVQISPTEEPVCRLMDFNKTMEEKARSKVASLKQQAMVKKKDKELRLGTSISDKDLETKLRQAKEFLSEQRTVTMNILYRRSKALRVEDRKARGEEIANIVDDSFQDVATLIGKKDTLGFLSLIYKPLPESAKRKRQKEKEKQKMKGKGKE